MPMTKICGYEIAPTE